MSSTPHRGRRGSDIEQFNTPHGVVIDSKGTIYVTDRGNRRIQVFSADGKFLKVWNNVGAPWSDRCLNRGLTVMREQNR